MVGWTFRKAKKVVVGVIGFAVLAAGVAMIVLPGPALIVIPAGLAILATEFHWATSALKAVRERFARLRTGMGSKRKHSDGSGDNLRHS